MWPHCVLWPYWIWNPQQYCKCKLQTTHLLITESFAEKLNLETVGTQRSTMIVFSQQEKHNLAVDWNVRGNLIQTKLQQCLSTKCDLNHKVGPLKHQNWILVPIFSAVDKLTFIKYFNVDFCCCKKEVSEFIRPTQRKEDHTGYSAYYIIKS